MDVRVPHLPVQFCKLKCVHALTASGAVHQQAIQPLHVAHLLIRGNEFGIGVRTVWWSLVHGRLMSTKLLPPCSAVRVLRLPLCLCRRLLGITMLAISLPVVVIE